MASGARFSGPTIHFVDEEYDTGGRRLCRLSALGFVSVFLHSSADVLLGLAPGCFCEASARLCRACPLVQRACTWGPPGLAPLACTRSLSSHSSALPSAFTSPLCNPSAGPILAQAVVPVYPTDRPEQLAARVLKEEHKLYPQCVAALCEGRVTWRDDGVPIMWSAH